MKRREVDRELIKRLIGRLYKVPEDVFNALRVMSGTPTEQWNDRAAPQHNVDRVVAWAENHDRLADLVDALRDKLPSPDFEALAQQILAQLEEVVLPAPAGGPPRRATTPGPPPPASLDAAVQLYRKRKEGSFERWDLYTAGRQPRAGNRPSAIKLDDMYVPLRFHSQLDPSGTEPGEQLAPDKLWRRQRQVLVGVAGSGKTTWMRWTFRKLIGHPSAVPFILELRDIAAVGKTSDDARVSIDSHLATELAACGIANSAAVLDQLLAAGSRFKPVLLIDGWDELGAQGEPFRRRLREFCGAFPHVHVIVSSRPYGETRPAEVDDFETLYMQPLSDGDIQQLAGHFHSFVHGLDDTAASRATDAFIATLRASPDARDLARTALLLTMILLLSDEGPLPDRRHKLYSACLNNMLRRVTVRERDSASRDPDQWRPDDSDERLHLVAKFAYRMQCDGYESGDRGPIIRSWDQALDLLEPLDPQDRSWTSTRKAGFLLWLIASAGILIDRTDRSVHFAHLSFQEHLAAYHLFTTCIDNRLAAVQNRIDHRDWWETLRLWAALTGDLGRDKLSPVLDVLRKHREGYWLAGEIFADGTGLDSDFQGWTSVLPERLSSPFGAMDDCARAWRVSKQSNRHKALAAKLTAARDWLHWLEASWHAYWCQLAGLDVPVAPALAIYNAPTDSAAAVARSRALFGAAASWPDGGELAILRLWPSARAVLGTRLQAAISIGANRTDVAAILKALRPPPQAPTPVLSEASRNRLREYFGQYLSRVFGGDSVENVDQYFFGYFVSNFECRPDYDYASSFGRDFRRDFVRKAVRAFVRKFDWDFISNHGWDVGRQFARDYATEFVKQFVAIFGRHLAREVNAELVLGFFRDLILQVERDFGQAEALPARPWLPMFAVLEAGSIVGRAASRAVLGHGEFLHPVPLLKLFRAACKASFEPRSGLLGSAVTRACAEFHGDALWTALARHIARISTAEDRAFLEGLARSTEGPGERIQWGLKYYVRGDLVFDDDTEVTLDELCAEAGVALLPLLEPMPPEPDVPLPFGPADFPRRRGESPPGA